MADQPSRNPVAPLLSALDHEHLDPGYAEAAERKRAAPGGPRPPGRSRGPVVLLVIGCLIAGLVLGVAAFRTDSNEPRAENTRAALLQDIEAAQERQSQLAVSATELAEQLRASQSAAGAAGPVAEVTALENQGQLTPVTGPGLRITLDQPSAEQGQNRSVILDRDVQLLVNDLWAAGAEAIAIGGVRLNTRSAIRQAGGAILVDNRPVFWPLSVEAIGDPSAMQVKFISSPSYGRFSSFAQLYGIEFDRSAQESLSLPGGTAPDLLHAQPATTSATPAPTG
jgi:uncharacterized protein YlxW (UPF0749 family)